MYLTTPGSPGQRNIFYAFSSSIDFHSPNFLADLQSDTVNVPRTLEPMTAAQAICFLVALVE